MQRNRREFLNDIGSGMLIAGLGSSLAGDLGISPAFAADDRDTLDFGDLRPLVEQLRETPPDKLQPLLVKQLQDGQADYRRLIAAAALANAETFGGTDYVGFHTEMALLPAFQMIDELPADRRPLPVLKVLYRNSERIQKSGRHRALKPIAPAAGTASNSGGEQLREASRAADMQRAEQLFAAQAATSIDDAYNQLLWSVQDNINVHRFVLAHRSWGLIPIVGQQHAHTMLRQCVRYCVDEEQNLKSRNRPTPTRTLVPKLLDQYKLLASPLGSRRPDDAWVIEMAELIYRRTGAEAMDAVAAALADGIDPESIGEAISLACNTLVLCQDRFDKGTQRVHGANPGVHSADAANAWRNIARVADQRGAVVGLLLAAYHTGGYSVYQQAPLPHEAARDAVSATDAEGLLAVADAAIRENDQHRATAAIALYGQHGFAERPVFDLMLRYAISEDGRLHAEKYYRTVSEEFATLRPKLRWQLMVGLARVTASAYGYSVDDRHGHRAPGYLQACELLNLPA